MFLRTICYIMPCTARQYYDNDDDNYYFKRSWPCVHILHMNKSKKKDKKLYFQSILWLYLGGDLKYANLYSIYDREYMKLLSLSNYHIIISGPDAECAFRPVTQFNMYDLILYYAFSYVYIWIFLPILQDVSISWLPIFVRINSRSLKMENWKPSLCFVSKQTL